MAVCAICVQSRRRINRSIHWNADWAHEEDLYPRQSGRVYWVRWSMKPWRNINGRIGGAMLFARPKGPEEACRRANATRGD